MALAVAWVYLVLVASWAVLELFERRRRRRRTAAASARPARAPDVPRPAHTGPPRRDDLPAFASFHPDAPLAAVLHREVTQADVDEMLREVERHLADH